MGESGKGQQKGSTAVKTVRDRGQAEWVLYTANTWSVLISEPCDCPQGDLQSSGSLSLPARLSVWVSSCRLCVSAC